MGLHELLEKRIQARAHRSRLDHGFFLNSGRSPDAFPGCENLSICGSSCLPLTNPQILRSFDPYHVLHADLRPFGGSHRIVIRNSRRAAIVRYDF